MSQQNYRSGHQNHDAHEPHLNLGAHGHNMPSKRSPCDEMNSCSESVSSSTSLYANPPSPVLHPGIHPHIGKGYTTSESVSPAVRAATVHYNEVSGPRFADRYGPGNYTYQAFPPVESTFESSGPSSTNSPYRPRTPPTTLSPLLLDAVHQRPPGHTHPLPEPLSKYLRVARPNPSASTKPSHTVTDASSTAPSGSKAQKTEKGRKKKAPRERMNELEPDILESIKPGHEEKRITQIDLQDMAKKLETAFQDPRMNKGESACKKKRLEKNWCHQHLEYDTCDTEGCEGGNWVYPYPRSSVKKTVLAPKPKASNSTVTQTASSVAATPPAVIEVESDATKTIPEKGYTDLNRFIDLNGRQHASWAPYRQNDALCGNETVQHDEQRIACERTREAAIKSEAKWRLEADKVSKDLKQIEKKVQASSPTTVCGKKGTLNLAPKKALVNASSVKESNTSAKMLHATEKTGGAVTSYSALRRLIEGTARPLDDSIPDLDLTMKTPPFDPLVSSLPGKQAAKTKDEIKATEAVGVAAETRTTTSRLDTLATNAEANSKWDGTEMSEDEGWEKVIGDDDSDWEVVGK
ncbi:uncharacterized protein EKO05_0005814 [Ascochyta rabiei]|uniref:Uncharacterized protein n=1 Tax=Didymella rabiei TaxID=5454 RepID=A0A163LLJ6_DIDRA|nr:uncharacterized protein EKO05_0005814 [Ascochyta rabiei]KZM27900.1 hypothetical protein ST47_g952 [Ascochyta rabiei]UPX15367.1 hypothetical protein EKO05_0005814 [Ascochyta rabiei]